MHYFRHSHSVIVFRFQKCGWPWRLDKKLLEIVFSRKRSYNCSDTGFNRHGLLDKVSRECLQENCQLFVTILSIMFPPCTLEAWFWCLSLWVIVMMIISIRPIAAVRYYKARLAYYFLAVLLVSLVFVPQLYSLVIFKSFKLKSSQVKKFISIIIFTCPSCQELRFPVWI